MFTTGHTTFDVLVVSSYMPDFGEFVKIKDATPCMNRVLAGVQHIQLEQTTWVGDTPTCLTNGMRGA